MTRPSPQRLIETIIRDAEPERMLLLGSLPEVDLAAACHSVSPRVTRMGIADADKLQDLAIHDLALIGEVVEHLPGRAGEHLLARLRDLHARRVVVRLAPGREWSLQRLTGLGFTCLQTSGSGDAEYFGFDIATYKTTPDWLNSRNWANPELFDKYRW